MHPFLRVYFGVAAWLQNLLGQGMARFLLLGLLSWILCSCATTSPHLVLDPIGPPPKSSSHGREGLLQVFSATTTVNDGGIAYYPHTAYNIYRPDGTFVKFVRNHNGATDQAPQRVVLSVGDYYVIATSEGYGVVKAPVIIKGGQLTGVYLDHTQMREARQAKAAEVVRFPNGWAVGWRAKAESEH